MPTEAETQTEIVEHYHQWLATQRAAVCSLCPAPIIWRRHKTSGKPTPINAVPEAEGGNVLIDEEHWWVASKEEQEANQGRLHLNHFATCPRAAAIRARGH